MYVFVKNKIFPKSGILLLKILRRLAVPNKIQKNAQFLADTV